MLFLKYHTKVDTMLRKIFITCSLLIMAISTPAFAGDTANEINAIADGDHRSAKNRARNTFRHPGETLEFFGIQNNMTVVEISPGGGWYTEILAPYLKESGKYYAASYDPDSDSEYQQRNFKRYADKLAANPELYGNVDVRVFNPPHKIQAAPAGSADMVVTFRNTHSWLRSGNLVVAMQAMYDSLKPGGVLGLVQHRGNAEHTKGNVGYVSPALVIEAAESVGFTLEAQSEVNANLKDSKDHPQGVWNLPPSYQDKDKDRAKYTAIGESDRMTLRFRKGTTE